MGKTWGPWIYSRVPSERKSSSSVHLADGYETSTHDILKDLLITRQTARALMVGENAGRKVVDEAREQ